MKPSDNEIIEGLERLGEDVQAPADFVRDLMTKAKESPTLQHPLGNPTKEVEESLELDPETEDSIFPPDLPLHTWTKNQPLDNVTGIGGFSAPGKVAVGGGMRRFVPRKSRSGRRFSLVWIPRGAATRVAFAFALAIVVVATIFFQHHFYTTESHPKTKFLKVGPHEPNLYLDENPGVFSKQAPTKCSRNEPLLRESRPLSNRAEDRATPASQDSVKRPSIDSSTIDVVCARALRGEFLARRRRLRTGACVDETVDPWANRVAASSPAPDCSCEKFSPLPPSAEKYGGEE